MLLQNFLLGLSVIASIFTGSQVEPKLAATIATTSISDTIGTFRTNVNTSLENINAQLESVSSSIGSYGTIAVENAPLRTIKGGTGTSTEPSGTQVLSNNGTSTAWKNLTGSGAITISTTTTGIDISSTGFDAGGTYSFTGGNTFSSGTTLFSSTLNASGTVNISGGLNISSSTNFSGSTTFSSATTTFNNNISFSTTTTSYTNAVLWQSLGSVATSTSASNSQATAAIVRIYGTAAGCSSGMGGEMTIFKTGKTGGQINFAECNGVNGSEVSATWSGSTVTMGSVNITRDAGNSHIFWFK